VSAFLLLMRLLLFFLYRASNGNEVKHVYQLALGRVGPNPELGTVVVYITNGSRKGLKIGREVGPCPGTGDGDCQTTSLVTS